MSNIAESIEDRYSGGDSPLPKSTELTEFTESNPGLMTPAHWLMLKYLGFDTHALKLPNNISRMLSEENEKDAVLWLYFMDPNSELIELICQIRNIALQKEGHKYKGKYSNHFFLQNLDRQRYLALISIGEPYSLDAEQDFGD